MSILQVDENVCFLCNKPANYEQGGLDKHHCFGGALRPKSEKLGLTVKLHHKSCHLYGKNAVHQNATTMEYIKRVAQAVAMKAFNWDTEKFREEFYKNYL